jgi:hypothetical protein
MGQAEVRGTLDPGTSIGIPSQGELFAAQGGMSVIVIPESGISKDKERGGQEENQGDCPGKEDTSRRFVEGAVESHGQMTKPDDGTDDSYDFH